MSGARKNAVEKRLEIIETHWNEFASDPSLRLMRWLVDPDEARMIEAFLEVENEEVGTVPDLFIRFTESFTEPERHGFTLVEGLRRRYAEVREGLAQESIRSDWECPGVRAPESDVEYFVRCAASLQGNYSSIMERFVGALVPEEVSDPAGWEGWLRRLVATSVPESVRFLLIDHRAAPQLNGLAESHPDLIRTVNPELNMPSAYLELARGSGKSNPGVSFRLNFVALTQAAAAGDLVKARKLGDAALAIAQEHGWPQMQFVVHMALGAASLGAKDVDGALAVYRKASEVGKVAAASGDSTAPKLVLQSALSQGAALVSGGRYAEAAPVYEESADLAKRVPDPMMTMEAWRMAAYCHEATGRVRDAWRCGQAALDASEGMDPSSRANSTLPYAGQGLLRLLDPKVTKNRAGLPGTDGALQALVLERMAKLAGPDWEKKLEDGRTQS